MKNKSEPIYIKVAISFMLGVIGTYIYCDMERVKGVKSTYSSNVASEATSALLKMDLVNLVKENKLNDFYRISCLSLKTNYMVMTDLPFEIELHDWQLEAIQETELFIEEYNEQNLCSLKEKPNNTFKRDAKQHAPLN